MYQIPAGGPFHINRRRGDRDLLNVHEFEEIQKRRIYRLPEYHPGRRWEISAGGRKEQALTVYLKGKPRCNSLKKYSGKAQPGQHAPTPITRLGLLKRNATRLKEISTWQKILYEIHSCPKLDLNGTFSGELCSKIFMPTNFLS